MGERASSLVRAFVGGHRKRSSTTDLADCDSKRFCPASPESKARRQVCCPICNETLSQGSALQRHLDNIHGRGKRQYHCSLCGQIFKRKDSRDRHVNKHTKADYVTCLGCAHTCRKDYLGQHLRSIRGRECQAAYAGSGESSAAALSPSIFDADDAPEEENFRELELQADPMETRIDDDGHAMRRVVSSITSSSKSMFSRIVGGPASSTNTIATSNFDSPCRRSEDDSMNGADQEEHKVSIDSTTSGASGCLQTSHTGAFPSIVPNSPLLMGIPSADEMWFDIDAIPEDEGELDVHRRQLHDLQERAFSNNGTGSSIEKQVQKRLSKTTRKNIQTRWPLPGEACLVCEMKFANPSNKKRLLQHLKQHVTETPEPRHTCEFCGISFVFKNDLRRHIKSKPCGTSAGCELGSEADDWSHVMREGILKDLRAWERYQICDFVYRLMHSGSAHQRPRASLVEAEVPRCSWPSQALGSTDTYIVPTIPQRATTSRTMRPSLTSFGSTRSQSSRHDSVVSCPFNTDYGTRYNACGIVTTFKQMSLYSEDGQVPYDIEPRYQQVPANCILHGKRQGQQYRRHNDICANCRKNGLWEESIMGHLRNVQILLQASIDPSTCPDWSPHESPLAAAVRCDHIKIAELLISHGDRLHKHASEAETFVHYFCQHVSADDSSFSMVLLEAGLNPNAAYQGTSLLTWVAANARGSSKLARMLLEFGADPNAGDDRHCLESIPLGIACDTGAYEIVKTLLEYGAKTNMRDPGCSSAFQISCLSGHDNVVRLLLEERRVPETVSDICSTMLVHACTRGHENVVETLLEFGANPRAINDQVFGMMAALDSRKRLNIKNLLLSKDRPAL